MDSIGLGLIEDVVEAQAHVRGTDELHAIVDVTHEGFR